MARLALALVLLALALYKRRGGSALLDVKGPDAPINPMNPGSDASGKVPYFDGMPADIPMPAGYSLVDLRSVGESGTQYEPRKFVQFHELVDAGVDASSEFQKRYVLGVIEGETLTFYVIASPTSPALCCERIECTEVNKRFNDESEPDHIGTSGGGTPAGTESRLPPPDDINTDPKAKAPAPRWDCKCTRLMGPCFNALPRPVIDWPHVRTVPGEQATDLAGA